MARDRAEPFRSLFADQPQMMRRCEVPGCPLEGNFKAPKGRDQLTDYQWLCLDHVREYNSNWDYYKGMSETEIEQEVRRDMTWQRPTWPMGFWRRGEEALRRAATDGFPFGRQQAEEAAPVARRPSSPEDDARIVLQVGATADFAEVKARYRALVKQHHPDANGGDPGKEEHLKRINHAYTTLKACLDPS